MQVQADFDGAPVRRPACVETTAMGAAYLAGLAVRYWESTDEIREKWKIDREFIPVLPEKKDRKNERLEEGSALCVRLGKRGRKIKNCRCGIIPVTAILLFIEEEVLEDSLEGLIQNEQTD